MVTSINKLTWNVKIPMRLKKTRRIASRKVKERHSPNTCYCICSIIYIHIHSYIELVKIWSNVVSTLSKNHRNALVFFLWKRKELYIMKVGPSIGERAHFNHEGLGVGMDKMRECPFLPKCWFLYSLGSKSNNNKTHSLATSWVIKPPPWIYDTW